MQRNLRALPRRGHEQQETDRRDGARTECEGAHRGVHGGDVERAEGAEHQEHREQETGVADAVDDVGLAGGVDVGPLLEPEGDEQIGAHPYPLPADEHEQVRVGHYQHEHRRHEEVEVGEVAREARIGVHVTDRVDVDERAHPRDHEHHQQRELVEVEAERELDSRDREIVPERHDHGLTPAGECEEGDEAEHETGADGDGSDDARQRLTQPRAQETVDERAQERQRRRERRPRDDVLGHSRTSARVSTSVLTRRRKIATKMPRPTATSAAATARMMKTAVCPVMPTRVPAAAHWRAYATSARFAALSMSSTERKIMIALRRVSTPTAPMAKTSAERAT